MADPVKSKQKFEEVGMVFDKLAFDLNAFRSRYNDDQRQLSDAISANEALQQDLAELKAENERLKSAARNHHACATSTADLQLAISDLRGEMESMQARGRELARAVKRTRLNREVVATKLEALERRAEEAAAQCKGLPEDHRPSLMVVLKLPEYQLRILELTGEFMV